MSSKTVIIPRQLSESRIIPLKPFSKIAQVKWANDTFYSLESYPESTGYGIDTERSSLVVIDCDENGDVSGVINLFEALSDSEVELPSTLTVNTPNGGKHFYFRNTDNIPIPSSAGTIAKNVDVRGRGGYIVGPGSIIKDKNGDEKEYIIIDDEIDICELPEDLATFLSPNKKEGDFKDAKKLSVTEVKDRAKSDEHKVIEQKNAFNWGKNKIERAERGVRNKTLNHVAYFMGCKRVPLYDAQNLIEVAIGNGMKREEAEKTFKSGYEKGLLQNEYDFEQVINEFNQKMGESAKSDPLNTAFYTHSGLADQFFVKNPSQYIYWTGDSRWYKYSEERGVWNKVTEDEMFNAVEDFLDDLVEEIRGSIQHLPSNIYKLHERLWVKNYIDSVSKLCRSRYLRNDPLLFDADESLLNVKNGVVDLKNGVLSPHSKNYYFTKYVNIAYEEDAADELCDKIVESIHPDERDFMQLIAGQALTGNQPNTQFIMFLHGRGSNGKSTFIDLMLKTSGDYARLQPPSVFLQNKNGNENYAFADFEGLRTAVIEELPNSKILDSGALKRLVGTQKINSRKIYGSHKEFINQSTVFVSCNKLPTITETDDGTWRRVLVVSFPYSYKKNPSDIKGKWDKKADPFVLYAAQNNVKTAKAFLKWRIDGAKKWYKDGAESETRVPETIVKRVQDWNENNDLYLGWFNDQIEVCTDSIILVEDLWNSFNDWLSSRGNARISQRIFVDNFMNHKVFFDNKLTYRRRARISVMYTRSPYVPEGEHTPLKTAAGAQPSYVVNLKFK